MKEVRQGGKHDQSVNQTVLHGSSEVRAGNWPSEVFGGIAGPRKLRVTGQSTRRP